jgi:glutathionyl-hydroquinone reductase
MNESLRTAIQEAFAECLTNEDITIIYAELRLEIDVQMKYMHENVNGED